MVCQSLIYLKFFLAFHSDAWGVHQVSQICLGQSASIPQLYNL